MIIPYSELKRTFQLHKKEYEAAALRVLESGWYILGREVEKFENAFADYLGVKKCVALNSGTDALIIAVRALNIGVGDEVIVPANTYIATVIGITENGATPVFVDADEYMEIDADQIEEKITSNNKEIMVTHLYGHPSRMDKIRKIAEKNKVYLIEDCAQSHGAQYDSQFVGTFGTVGCFSFYPTKPLGAMGDAGAIVTNDEELAEKVRMLRNYGSKKKYENEINGVNSRMDEIQAALLQVGLKYLDENNAERIHIAEKYINEIDNKKIKKPVSYKKAKHIYHLFPVLVENREEFQKYLESKGINTAIHYPVPPYVAGCYKNWEYGWDDYPKSSFYARHEVSLPIYAGMPEEEVGGVISAVNEYQG